MHIAMVFPESIHKMTNVNCKSNLLHPYYVESSYDFECWFGNVISEMFRNLFSSSF